MRDVAIVNALTAFTNQNTGETIILRFNQVLWYGKKLKMSLINPNQLRYFGLVVSDDPTDKTRDFGITGDDLFIPFEMAETTIFFITREPTQREMENCRVVEMMDENPWNPANGSFVVVWKLRRKPSKAQHSGA